MERERDLRLHQVSSYTARRSNQRRWARAQCTLWERVESKWKGAGKEESGGEEKNNRAGLWERVKREAMSGGNSWRGGSL